MQTVKTVIFSSLLLVSNSDASWQDQVGSVLESVQKKDAASNAAEMPSVDLSNSDMTSALKEALSKGVKFAVSNLGKEGGYLDNPLVKIPLPKTLQSSEKLIRKMGGDKYVDGLILSINRAAEEAAPQTVNIFIDAIEKMTITDGKTILAGDDDAATQYFRKHTNSELSAVIEPIVKKSMENNDVASYYKSFQTYYKSHADLVKNDTVSALTASTGLDAYLPGENDEEFDSYVTHKAIDGLMTIIAEKEKEIRDNPLMRNSDLLKKVFGAF